MTPEQFAYWLQGFVELQGSEPTAEQWQQIKDHLQTVFVKVTPQRIAPTPVVQPTPVDDGWTSPMPRWPYSPWTQQPVIMC
ncbi:hypothetical protein [Bowmanella yangjiangensis]|uniref:Uncharacterized protein n=1 Tax=Bowmanella yangjiangensis TaxID=2811230 RepID=A0ABS3CYK9_9ALTE|nr:hypothetical protein [Bowmanella yangjiangensis]MBN7822183.1 hypothetical protein [Bowmanella yangjiangensis]